MNGSSRDPRQDARKIADIALEKVRLSCYQSISRTMIEAIDLRPESSADFIAHTFTFQLRAAIYAHEVERHTERYEEVPRTWWDHFKRDVLPSWLIRRQSQEIDREDDDCDPCPWYTFLSSPRTRTIVTEIRHYHSCPHVEMPPNHRAHFAWLAQSPVEAAKAADGSLP